MKTEIRKKEWAPTKDFLPLILGQENKDPADKQSLAKIDLFEKGLAKEIKKDDSIEQAITKMVKMALAAEFGASLVTAKGAAGMVTTITQAIMCDPVLRKQALMIIDRFTNA
ncbi:MAG: hypothetical protein ABIH50_04165 [bacterium]